VVRRRCVSLNDKGSPCKAAPLRDSDYCLMHSPEHSQEVADSRRLGGLRRKREVTLAGAYDFYGLRSIFDILRLLDIAAFDTLGMENSPVRSRILVSVSLAALKALEVGEHEHRLSMLEAAVHRHQEPGSEFDKDPKAIDFPTEEATG
jgi:hypothetical protein